MTADLDYAGVSKAMNGLYDALMSDGREGDAQKLLVNQACLLNKKMADFTPPMNASGGVSGAEAAGKKAIERELKNLISEAHGDLLSQMSVRYGTSNVDAWRAAADGSKLHLKWENIDAAGSRLPELHRRYRGRRGKVTLRKEQQGTWASRIVVRQGVRAAYIKKVQDQVGRWKASVSAFLVQMGKRLPRYVRKHMGSVSHLQIIDVSRLNHPTQPSVAFGSRFPGIGNPDYRYHQKLSEAVRQRQGAMLRFAQLILSGYAKDVSQGIKARRRAKDVLPPEPNYDE